MVNRDGRKRILLLATVLALLATACSGDDGGANRSTSTTRPGTSTGIVTGTRSAGAPAALSVSLSQGEAYSDVAAVVTVVDGRPLDRQSIADVIDRLPQWIPDPVDHAEFNRPAESLPRPRVGNTVEVAFPPRGGDTPPETVSGPLEVLRFQPDGDVGLAPFVSITFNQPMVPLGTVEQVESSDVPVTLTPDLPGRWQWIGTRTLRFEHDPQVFDRLPMATHYIVEVPSGTASAVGGVLAESVRWDFVTPAPSVRWLSPQDTTVGLEPVFLATFDQRVDPEATLRTISLTAGGDRREIRLATAEEIEVDEVVQPRSVEALEGTWVAFRAVDAFEPDQRIQIKVGPDVPSAEGPDTSGAFAEFRVNTYAPLRVVDRSCTKANPCSPGWGMSVEFNNQLVPTSLDPADLKIEPVLPGASVSVQWSAISIQGESAGDTIYKVTVPGALTDIYGQTLGNDTVVESWIGPASPQIDQLQRQLVTLDPLSERQTFPVTVRKHETLRVRVYDVSPDDWSAFERHLERRWESDGPAAPPDFPLLRDEIVSTGADDDDIRREVRIDLGPIMNGEHGQVVVRIDGTGRFADMGPRDNEFWDNAPIEVWVQDTDIGLDMINDATTGVAWTTDLRTGEPLDGVELKGAGIPVGTTTEFDGLATFDLGARPLRPLVAGLGDDVAINPTWVQRSDLVDQTIWYVVDDRGMYRPGETVRVKGWVRNLDTGSGGVLGFPDPNELLDYVARDSFGIELGGGRLFPDDVGGFDLEFDLPAGSNLGSAWIEFRRPGDINYGYFSHSFQIQEFRRPEFEVTTRAESPGPYFTDEPATVVVEAEYFSGGPLPDAPVDWRVTTQQASYSPPNWSEFTFGEWTPWWILDGLDGYGDYGYAGYPPGQEPIVETFSGRTDGSGRHYLRMDFTGDGAGLPATVTAEASVTDVNRQVWTDRTDVLVHPASLYVGLRSTRTFVQAGDPLDVEAITTDIDGNPVPDREFTMTAERLVNQYVEGEWTEVAIDVETCDVASGGDPVSCTFAMGDGGRWRISADVVDDSGRMSRSEMIRWVSGGDAVPSRSLDLQSVTLVPDQPTYAVGETAEILVVSPFGPATGLLTWGTGGIEETTVFSVDDTSAIVKIPITDAGVPRVLLQVELVGTTERVADDGTSLPGVPPRPAFATGSLDLRVPPASRTLGVTVTPADGTIAPGSSTSIDVAVLDAAGVPVSGARMLVVVVDEAILALSGYELLDPLAVFFRPAGFGIGVTRGRDSILLEDPGELIELLQKQAGAPATTAATRALGGADGEALTYADDAAVPAAEQGNDAGRLFDGDASGSGAPVEVRQNFDALAAFEPDVTTGVDGTANVAFDLPDSLTRYRVMVVAVDGPDRFGTGESTITALLPLQVRPSAPRFLNFGDQFELPIVVQNLTNTDTEIDVVIETSNLEIVGSPGRRVTVPANNRVEVRFPARTDSPGTARFRVAAVGGGKADAATVSLPVYTPATAEAFATYGVIDGGTVIQPILTPEGVFPQFGGLEVGTSSTALQALTDAVLYLSEYEYRSSDAYASRILGITALRDVLDAFRADGMPTPAEMNATVRSDVTALSALQNYDGGFGSWRRDQQSSPFRSVQAMHALIAAKADGFAVRADVTEMGRSYLRDIESHIPANWSRSTKDMLIAYSLYVRRLDGDVDASKARSLWNRSGSDLGLDASAWIWPVVSDARIEAEISRTFANRVTETPQAATFTTTYGEDDYLVLNSDRRTDGIVLGAMVEMEPGSDLIPKIVAGLIANQVKGRWNNVQENSFILLALNDYFDTFETIDPDFVARVWLGDDYVAEHAFSGRTIDQVETLVPMSELTAGAGGDLIVQKDGPGRLYYRLGLRYAPDELALDPLDKGFVVQRSYEGIDDPSDVWLDSEGVWHVRSGAKVRVRVTVVNDSRRTNMALIDPLPAGLEPLNPALATTGEISNPVNEGFADRDASAVFADGGLRWWGPWFDHQNLRDDRAEAYSAYLGAGTHEYIYIARATTPGTFVVPPSRAEEIYAPEVFGRSAGTVMVVGDPSPS